MENKTICKHPKYPTQLGLKCLKCNTITPYKEDENKVEAKDDNVFSGGVDRN
jgi:hypothetical protein